MKRAMVISILCTVMLSACGNVSESIESAETSAVSQTTTTVTASAVTSAKEEKDTSETTTTTRKSSQTVSETSASMETIKAKTTKKSTVSSSAVSEDTPQEQTEPQSYPQTEQPQENTQVKTTQKPATTTTQQKQTTAKKTTTAPPKPATTTQKPQTTTPKPVTNPESTVTWTNSMKVWRKLCEGKSLSGKEQDLIRSEILEYAQSFNGKTDIHVSFGIDEYDISYEKPLNLIIRNDMTDLSYAHMDAYAYADSRWLIDYAGNEEEIYSIVSNTIEDMIENGLTDLDFSDLVAVPDEVIEHHTGKDEQTVELMSDAADVADISSPADDVPAVTLKYKGDAESLDEIKDKALSLGATVIVDNAKGVISIDTYADHTAELDGIAYELGLTAVDDAPAVETPTAETEDIDRPLFTDAAVIDEIQRNENADVPFWEMPEAQGEQLSLFGDPEPLTASKPAPEKPKSEFAKGPVVDGVQVYEALAAEIDRGTGFVHGKLRVQDFYEEKHPTIQQLADFLKKEYGTGGHSGEGKISLVDYNSQGITFSFENGEKFRHSWYNVATMTESRLKDDTYLSAEQKAERAALKAEKAEEQSHKIVEVGDRFRHKITGEVSEVISLTGALPFYSDDCTIQRESSGFAVTENISYDKLLNSGMYEYIGRTEPEKEQSAPVKPEKAEVTPDNSAVAPEAEKPEIPTVKNLSQLKKTIKPGMMFEISDHLRPECIGERRVVTGVTTVDFTSRKLDENGEPTGKDLHMEFDRAKNWTFDGGELTSRLDNGDMLMSFHFIDSLEREQTVQAEKEPEIVPVVDEVGSDSVEVDTSAVDAPAPEKGDNFTITDDNLGDGGAKTKFRANVDAIKTLKTLEREKRPATAEEKETLSKYVGWGALAKAFDKDDPKWAAEYKELSELLTPQEYAQARSTVNDAFYTSPTVIERQNGYKSVFK